MSQSFVQAAEAITGPPAGGFDTVLIAVAIILMASIIYFELRDRLLS